MNLKKIFILPSLFLFSALVFGSEFDSISEVEILSPYSSISEKTERIPIGLKISLKKGWHSYWRYAGDSGKSLKVKWILPRGSFIKDHPWPLPERIVLGSSVSFGYKDSFLLMYDLFIPQKKPVVEVIAQVEWVICKTVCIPIEKTIKAVWEVRERTIVNKKKEVLFDKWSHRQAIALEKTIVLKKQNAFWKAQVKTKEFAQLVDVFPFSGKDFSTQKPHINSSNGQEHLFSLFSGEKKNALATNHSDKLLLVFQDQDRKFGFVYPFRKFQSSIWWFILLAFLGGLVLNFMPCVLPIVFLKFSNALEEFHKLKHRFILGNVFYSMGVIGAFLFLALLVLLIKEQGKDIHWGFQMQSPYFLIGLLFLFVLVSLNFMSWFSVSFSAPVFFRHIRGKSYLKHFLTGVLSTVVASPCTAPFMGAAVGYAFLNSPMRLIIIFLFLGVGLSFPYLLLSFFPHWIKFVPLPGKSSERLKHFMAFPMLATAIWLIHIFNKQNSGLLLELLFSLLFFALGFWILKEMKNKILQGFAFIGILSAVFYSFFVVYQGNQESLSSIEWKAFSIQKLENTVRPVFVNFTADWCLTCQFNDKVTFQNKKIVMIFGEKNILALKGDATNKNKEIELFFKKYNRAGVPFYIYFPQGYSDTGYIILPEILMPASLLKYLK